MLLARANEAIEWPPFFAAVRLSGIGTKRTYRNNSRMSAFGGKADMA
jgi:hypothetical protein